MNYFEFCVLPRPTSTTMLFWDMIKRYYVRKFASQDQLDLSFENEKSNESEGDS